MVKNCQYLVVTTQLLWWYCTFIAILNLIQLEVIILLYPEIHFVGDSDLLIISEDAEYHCSITERPHVSVDSSRSGRNRVEITEIGTNEWKAESRLTHINPHVNKYFIHLFETKIVCALFTDVVCGLGNGPSSISSRIIGGTEASPNEFPWQVYLIAFTSSGPFSGCGATLIDSQWVLTAAHCFDQGYIFLNNDGLVIMKTLKNHYIT